MAERFEPVPDGDSAPFWEALSDGSLLVRRCATCGRAHWYPRPHCPHCWSDDAAWEPVSGAGTLYTFTVIRRTAAPSLRDRVPYAVGLVDLDEGPRVVGFIEGPITELAVGRPVTLDLVNRDDPAAIVFRLED